MGGVAAPIAAPTAADGRDRRAHSASARGRGRRRPCPRGLVSMEQAPAARPSPGSGLDAGGRRPGGGGGGGDRPGLPRHSGSSAILLRASGAGPPLMGAMQRGRRQLRSPIRSVPRRVAEDARPLGTFGRAVARTRRSPAGRAFLKKLVMVPRSVPGQWLANRRQSCIAGRDWTRHARCGSDSVVSRCS